MTTTPRDSAADYRYPIPDDENPCHVTVLAVAAALDRDALDLPPLAGTIDPDALDGLVGASPEPRRLSVTFEYAGCVVTVTPDDVRATVR
jgi:hypothetical protein